MACEAYTLGSLPTVELLNDEPPAAMLVFTAAPTRRWLVTAVPWKPPSRGRLAMGNIESPREETPFVGRSAGSDT